MKILVLNAGSSSQKSALYDVVEAFSHEPVKPIWEASSDSAQHPGQTQIKITGAGQTIEQTLETNSRAESLTFMLKTLWRGKTQMITEPADIDVVGHRVVHGGHEYQQPVRITTQVRETIHKLSAFAPLHNPVNLEGIETITQLLPDVPQVAVFDTAFHHTLPLEAAVYPGPFEWFEQGIRRYGFHGLSHHYCMLRTAYVLRKDRKELRMIICHLGNGCSLSAIQHGQSIDTTMGFTPLDGIMMGSRSGSVDPGILTYLMRQYGYSAEELDTILNKKSGLKGISGLSSDMRDIHEAIQQGNERAELALDLYVHRLCAGIGSMLTSLRGCDALIFTGGVGEHDVEVRERACERLAFLNLKIDVQKNVASPVDQDIATGDSAVRVLVIHTEEDWMIARACWHVMQ